VRLAERLRAIAPVDDGLVHFSISGAEAVEVALKTALLATGRPGIVAFEPAYHGTTLGALAATSRPAFREPFLSHLTPHLRRLPFGVAIDRVAAVLERRGVGCLLVEPVVGREGVLLPPDGWLAALARACAESGTLLVADEIFTGLGRTGHLFALDREGVAADIVCCGKALAGGLPLSAVVGRRRWMEAWRTNGEALHTATFLAHPVACAAALATLDSIEEEDLVARSAALGRRLADRAARWPERFDDLIEVRGRGLLWGLELRDRAIAGRFVAAAWNRGLLLLAGGPAGRVAQIVPPLTISERQLDFAVEAAEEALQEIS
jgi:4-aminobutyrate aminotransferase-like enzyme